MLQYVHQLVVDCACLAPVAKTDAMNVVSVNHNSKVKCTTWNQSKEVKNANKL